MKYLFEDWQSGRPLPKGWDGADAVDDGWSRDQIDAFMRATAKPWVPPKPDPKPAAQPAKMNGHAVSEPAPVMEIERPEPAAMADLQEEGRDLPALNDDYYPSCIPADLRRSAFNELPWREHPLRKWVFLTSDCVFYNYETGDSMSKTAFDLAMAPVTPFVETETDKGTKLAKLAASKTLIERMQGRIVSGVMYRPDIPADDEEDLFFEWEGLQWVNSYLSSSAPKAAKNWQSSDAWKYCRDHIHRVVPEGADDLIKWMAHNVQRPGIKINWAPVIVGPEGTGKTLITDILKAAMGRRNLQVIGDAALFSDFTGWAEGACVRVMEEIRIPGEKRTAVMNKLKPYITNATVEVVSKGRNGREILNVTNYIALTNFRDALAVTEGDRRWHIWKTLFETREEAVRELGGKPYFDPIWHAVENHGDVIRGWLMSVDLSDFDRFNTPAMTEAKREMIEASRSPLDADMREAMVLGGEGIGPDVIATNCLSAAIKDIGGRSINTSTLANLLRECGWIRFEGSLKWREKTRRVYYRPGVVPEGMDGAALATFLRMKLDETVDSSREALPDGLDQW